MNRNLFAFLILALFCQITFIANSENAKVIADKSDAIGNVSTKPVLQAKVQAFLDDLAAKGGTPIYKLPVKEGRSIFSKLQAASKVSKLPVDIQRRMIPGGPKGEVSILIIRPKGVRGKLPVILYIHGGGWVFGGEDTHDRLVRELAVGAKAVLVFVNYTPAPEGQYPVAHEESYATLKWIAKNAHKINADASRIAIAGDSVGGLLSTAVALMAKERGGPKIIAQLLFYPVTNDDFNTGSFQQFADGYWLAAEGMKWFWDQYVPNKADRKEPYVAPLKASLEQLKGLPPTLLITNEVDVLRDEGEAYAHKLMQAGVPVVGVRFLGTIHDSMMLNAIAEVPTTRAAVALAIDMLKKFFAKKKS